jgi:hypothetical protein
MWFGGVSGREQEGAREGANTEGGIKSYWDYVEN